MKFERQKGASRYILPWTVACLLTTTAVFSQNNAHKTILFICEHGSAKSIVAAAHFERIAKSEGIQMNVVSRGTNPDDFIPDQINNLLSGDGFLRQDKRPVRLSSEDLRIADFVVAFSPIPASYGNAAKIETWSIPSFEAGYPAARDSIIHNIERIIQRIKSENQK